MVSDLDRYCPACSATTPSISSTDIGPTRSESASASLEDRDTEGYTAAERAARGGMRFPPPGGRKSPQDPLRRVSFAPEGAPGGTP